MTNKESMLRRRGTLEPEDPVDIGLPLLSGSQTAGEYTWYCHFHPG